MFAAGKTSGGGAAGAYQISRSLRFNSADSAYLNRTPSSSGNQQKFTFSYWFKRGTLSSEQVMFGINSAGNEIFTLAFLAGNTFRVFGRNGGIDVLNLTTTQLFRDPSAWYHIVVAIDTTQATSSNRASMYVNGVQVTAFGTATYPAQNTNLAWNSSSYSHQIGREDTGSYLNGYMTEVNFINAQQLTPSSFGQTNAQTGVWEPIAFSGTYGTNGFYVNFSDNSNTTAATLGKDYSGNGNNFTPNNFSVTAGAGNDSLVDVPTPYGADTGVGGEVRGNYNTWNPIGNGSGTLTNGNLDLTTTSTYANAGTLGLTSGKWYWEVTLQTSSNPRVGVFDIGSQRPSAAEFGVSAFGWCIINSPSRTYNNNSAPSYGAFTPVNGTIVILAYDADNGRLWYGQDGTWFASGDPATNANPSQTGVTGKAIVPACSSGSGNNLMSINSGQRPFAYTAPSGFQALNTQNLPTPTIGATTATQAGKYFNTVTYTGTGSSLGVTGVGFQPDWVWVKSRSAATDHGLYDAVRGVQKQVESNTTTAETTETTGITAFGSDGFTTGALAQLNTSAATYVAWNWRASNAAAVTNTSGTVTSTVSANTTAGFSIVTFSGNSTNGSVGHGLGAVPSMVIWRCRNQVEDWLVYHVSIGNADALRLNTTAASFGASAWQTATPTSSVVLLGAGSTNQTGQNNLLYCFAPVAGFSAFGSYTGNGNADGPFIYTGFKPAFIMYKRSSTAGNSWRITDSTRSTYNVDNAAFLYPDTSETENFNANDALDILSNGFKIRVTDPPSNTSGSTYIYMAFASNPFKYSLAR